MDVYGYLLMTSDVALILCSATMYWLSAAQTKLDPRLRLTPIYDQ